MWFNQFFSVCFALLWIILVASLHSLLIFLYASYRTTGKWKNILINLPKYSTFAGITLFVVGIVAAMVKQGFHVWFPIILCGMMLIILMGAQYVCFQRILANGKDTNELETKEVTNRKSIFSKTEK